jgi:heavy metal sensor kinase
VFAFVRTIRFKLTLWFVGILALVIFAVSALLYLGLQRVLLQSVDANLRTAGLRSVVPSGANANTDNTSESGDPLSEQNEQLRRLVLLSNTPARLLALDGNLLQSDPLFPRGISVTVEALQTANNGGARYETIRVGASTYRLYTAPIRVNDTRAAVVQVVDSLDEQLNTLANVRGLLIWLIPISLIFAAIGGSFLAGSALAPMTRVRRDVEKIIEQSDLSHRVSAGLPDDEVGRLARTFDQLLERVQLAMERERQFTSDASHELRSPLTVLKGEISVALSRRRSADEYRATLSQLESSVDDMSQLVEDLLTLTRAAANKQPVNTAPISVGELVTQISERMHVIADAKGITLNTPAAPLHVVVIGDRIKLQRVFTNLIDNALRYTPRGGRVDMGLRHEGNYVYIDVRDTGRGIATEHLPRLFQRFYRADNNRARDSGGSGLGLAIAQTIIKAHGGKITVSSRLGQGSCFTVMLPVHSTASQNTTPVNKPATLAATAAIAGASIDKKAASSSQPSGHPLPTSTHAAGPAVALHERSFRAMNTDINLFLLSADERHAHCVLDAAEWFFVQVEWRLSRFRESSELSQLNRQGTLHASRMLCEVMQLAAQAYTDTQGVFNPFIAPALIAAGYDRTFDEIGTDRVVTGSNSTPTILLFANAVTLCAGSHEITLHEGAQVDLGGIAKGWAIDRAFRTLSKLGPCCVNAGGDVRVGGSFVPGGDGWRVDVLDPFVAANANDADSLLPSTRAAMLKDKAIATSGILKRRWIKGGQEQHHLIDPRNGQPARNNLLFVTAMGDSAVQAEVAAKTIFILGEEEGSAWAQARRIPALIMLRNGEYLCNEWFPPAYDDTIEPE